MSGFIVSSGLDLDSIFQLKPPAITDASGILIGLPDGIETDPSGLLVVPATGFKIKKTVPIVTIVDLADHYKKKGINTYAVNTGFIINNMDLTNVFEWGGYTPSIITPITTVTGRRASITVSGNYYAVDISSNKYYGPGLGGNSGQVSHNPYTFSCITAGFGENVTFYVYIYNGFFGNKQFSTYTATTLGAPTLSTITLVSANASNLKFSFTGLNYSKINYFIHFTTGDEYVFTDILSSSPSSTIDIPIPITSNDDSFNIVFTPYNEFEEDGPETTKKIEYSIYTRDHEDVITSLTETTPSYTYRGDFFVVGAGGSGGSGGAHPKKTAGNGGSGGSGGYDVITGFVFDGKIAVRSVSYTCGKGGAGAAGVSEGSIFDNGNNGMSGEKGGSSSIVVTDVITVSASGGIGGMGGASGGSDRDAAAGGSPNGITGSGTTAGTLPYSGYGNGSNGSIGTKADNSEGTVKASNGFTRASFYYVKIS
jgi:hypothetical protein